MQPQALPGFRDFYPADFALRAHLFRTWRTVAARYGFEEYDGPPLEPLELYTAKSGEEIVGQLYRFTDKGDREVALRPEMTPTLARMVAARASALKKPIRWFSIPQLFRYERAQRGRLREHFQLNLDIVGEADVSADAELLAAAIDILRAFGLTEADFVARVSDRRLLRSLLLHAQVPDDRLVQVYNIVDKLEREPRERIAERLATEAGLGPSVVEEVLAIFRHTSFDEVRDAYGGTEGIGEEIGRMKEFLDTLDAMGLGGFVRFDLSVVRGLAYYTGIVFELFDARGELRAIAGGGRYDQLLQQVAGVDLPALGFGMGDVVLAELLKDRGLLPDTSAHVDFFLVAVTAEQRPDLLRLAHSLRDAGRSVDYPLRTQSFGKQLKSAAAVGASFAVILGPDELAQGEVVVRDMGGGEERRVKVDEVAHGCRPEGA
jgi:histidyl-tRNA synthetase